MFILNRDLLNELLAQKEGPFISIYMPAHQRHPENIQDLIHYKKLIKKLEASLFVQYSYNELKQYLSPLESLISDNVFWNHTTLGIAIFSAPGIIKVIGLHQPVQELAIVADSFHLKPLRQYLQTTDHYQVLALSLDRIKLFEGNRHGIVEITLLEAMPKTLTTVRGKELTKKKLHRCILWWRRQRKREHASW